MPLTIFFLTGVIKEKINKEKIAVISALIIFISLYITTELILTSGYKLKFDNKSLESFYDENDLVLIDKIKEYTDKDDVILLQSSPEHTSEDRFDAAQFLFDTKWVPLHILTQRNTMVNYKSTPIQKQALLRWYHLIKWRNSVFSGNCEELKKYPQVKYLITVEPIAFANVSNCGNIVWQSNDRSIIAVKHK